MPYNTKELQLQDEIQSVRTLFKQGGVSSEGAQITLRDALSTPDAPVAFKRVITEIVQEAIQPLLIGERLLDRISFPGASNQVTFRTFGAIGSEDLSMAEGQEYPEVSMATGQGNFIANIGKHGIAVSVTEEMLRYSLWDIVSMHVRQAGYALARHKERQIFNLINSIGVRVFDNQDPTKAQIGRTSGRDLTGAGNGSFTMDDLFDMYAAHVERGFNPDTILCHPLAWSTFAKDPVMREFALSSGSMSGWFNTMPTNVSPALPANWEKVGKMAGPSPRDPSKEQREGTQKSVFTFPDYSPLSGVKVLASPHVPFDATKKTTSILMLDSKNTGAIIVDEAPHMEEWRDPARDIYKIKIRERYGFGLYHDGLGVSVASNVSIEPNEIVLPPQATVANLAKIVRK